MIKLDEFNWRQLDTASAQLYYLVAGSREKPTLAFIPGWAGDARFWEDQVSHFSENHRVIAIDLPGWGRSELKTAESPSSNGTPHNIDLSLDYLAAQVLEVLEKENVKAATVIGHSLGGMVALAMGAQSPGTVSQVVGAESFIYMNAYPAQSENHTDAFTKSFEDDFDTSVDLLTQSFFAKHTPQSIIDTVTDTMKSVPKVESIEILRNFFLADLKQYLDAYPGPVSAIVAADNEDFSAFVKTFGDAVDIIEIKDSCHFVMMSEADQFNAALEKLLC